MDSAPTPRARPATPSSTSCASRLGRVFSGLTGTSWDPMRRRRVMRLGAWLTAWVGMCVLGAAVPVGAQEEGEGSSEHGDLPLEPGRTASIDLTEGSWMSVDVSPDGRTLVFDYLGDLFTLPVEGGDAVQLTSGMAFDAQPR